MTNPLRWLVVLLEHVHGFHEVSMVDGNSVVGIAQFDTPGNAMKFIRSQKKHPQIQTNNLWVAENRSRMERNQAKIASKLNKFLVELANMSPKNVIVNYKLRTEKRCPSHVWKTIWPSSGMMPAMCRQWCRKQYQNSFRTWSRDCTLLALLISERLQQGMVGTTHFRLQRMMLITRNSVCMSLPRICKAFGVNHAGKILLLSWINVVLIYCLFLKRGERRGMNVSSQAKGITFTLAAVQIIKELEFAYRRRLFHKYAIFLSMHIRHGFAVYISPWLRKGSECLV